ncbi:general substrate transporter [Zychaea mexicana]|uniref:general substrate transporter n=1 Tax=Zychaea mexicana TaxID=64656 RepID=UPI0022FEC1DA|nr:general substrate transporter [Zychaea mexicana]KAI9499214.1 general substrate transporter [Zychaea mexicana]
MESESKDDRDNKQRTLTSNLTTSESFDSHDNDIEQVGTASLYTYILVTCICVGGFLFGYDTGVISGALQPLQNDFHMDDVDKELVVGGTTFGAIFGGFFTGLLSDRFGRKPLIMISCLVFIAGALLLALPRSYGVLLFGRLVVGVGVGMSSMLVPVYISEVSPRQIRGRLTTLNTLVVTFGQVIAYVINIAFANVHDGWRYMFGLAGIPALIQLVVMPFLPESPRRLVAVGKADQAKASLRRIYGNSVSDSFLDREISSIADEVAISRSSTYKDFKKRENYHPLIIACILQAAQQLSGFNTAMYYAATILRMAGFRDHQNSTTVAIIVSATNMVFTAVAITMIDKVGRRRLLVVTMLIMIAGLIALGATFAAQQGFITKQDLCSGYTTHCARCINDDRCGWSISQDQCMPLDVLGTTDLYQSSTGCPPKSNDTAITGVLLAFLIVYVAGYALGLGYAPWVMQSEIFPIALRGKGTGVATGVNWICNLVISITYLSMINAMTAAGTFWFYAGISLIFWVLVFFFVPETAGRSLEEMNVIFQKK